MIATTLAVALLATAPGVSSAVCAAPQGEPQATQSVRIVGRFVDEDGQPICSAPVGLTRWSYWKHDHGGGAASRGFDLASDDQGRFEFDLPLDDRRPEAQTAVRFSAKELQGWELVLPSNPSVGRIDLGDVSLSRRGSTRWLARKDDSQLESEYWRAVAAFERNGANLRPVETCLTEMIRRGGTHWQAFVESELAHERAAQNPNEIEDLELLTALRRIQGKPDPLAVQLVGPPELECTFPNVPTIRVRLRNVDVDGETFRFRFGPRMFGQDLPIDVATSFAVEALDMSGHRVLPRQIEPVSGSIQFERAPLEQGVSLELELPLDQYLEWPSAGEFQMRVVYHDRARIAQDTDCDGWIASSTSWFIVHVKAK